jgi:hypothetical protein
MKKNKLEFMKKMLIADYAILIVLLIATLMTVFYSMYLASLQVKSGIITSIDVSNALTTMYTVCGSWVVQVGATSGFYAWKSKNQKKTQFLGQMLEEIPSDMRDRADPNVLVQNIVNS